MAGTGIGRTYSIKEVAALVGLPPSTLRYYEDVSVIPAIARDPSSGHRIYTEGDLELLTWVACLSASGMSIADMREYVRSGLGAERDVAEFISLLEQQDARLQEEAQIIELRREFLRTKIEYWRAMKSGDVSEAERLDMRARELAERLKSWSPRS
ncbi:MAG: MerR family transcriptional regulator [Pauljensenia sp.]|nr:MerR family transcriptional regulator [Pauljensenia sp.]